MKKVFLALIFMAFSVFSNAEELYMECEGEIYKHDNVKKTIEFRVEAEWVNFCHHYDGLDYGDPLGPVLFQWGSVWDTGGKCFKSLMHDKTIRDYDAESIYDFLFPSMIFKLRERAENNEYIETENTTTQCKRIYP